MSPSIVKIKPIYSASFGMVTNNVTIAREIPKVDHKPICCKAMPWTAGLTKFGDLLYSLIQQRGWGIREFSEKAGINHSMLSSIRAKRRPPPLKHVGKWADLLALEGADREYFLDLAALACAPDRVLSMFDPKHPAFQAIMLAQDHRNLMRELDELKKRVAEIAGDYEAPAKKPAKPGPHL